MAHFSELSSRYGNTQSCLLLFLLLLRTPAPQERERERGKWGKQIHTHVGQPETSVSHKVIKHRESFTVDCMEMEENGTNSVSHLNV